jgi:hypothetical protein
MLQTAGAGEPCGMNLNTTVAALLYDAQARRDALDLLLPRAGDQQRAWAEATTGSSPEAGALLSIARAAQHPREARPAHPARAAAFSR